MTSVQTLLHWLAHNNLMVAGLVYCAAVLGVTLYAYLFKYEVLNR
jgi:hypothetical protein